MSTERGSVTVMTLGFVGFLVLLAVVVMDSSAAFLAHQRLAAVADGAALAASEGLSREVFYSSGRVVADGTEARSLAERYVAATDPRARVMTEVTDGVVHVRLTRPITLPLVPPGWPPGTHVIADATARLLPAR